MRKIILGIDESAKCPVLGSLPVVCVGVYDLEVLKGLGIKDSKQIKKRKNRQQIYNEIMERVSFMEIIRIKPCDIDIENINDLEVKAIIQLLNCAKANHPKVDSVYIDLFDHSQNKFNERMRLLGGEHLLNSLNIIAEHYADENYLIVSAASIIAKERADMEMDNLNKEFGIGSGNPNDKKTLAFLRQHIDELNKYPFVRQSWGTVSKLKLENRNLNFGGMNGF